MLKTKNLSAKNPSDVNGIAGYFGADDYYTQGDHPSAFSGGLANQFNLTKTKVTQSVLSRLLLGNVPSGGSIKNAGEGKRCGLDLTFSAPKSVSIAALVRGDSLVIEAHNRAVERALADVEKLVGCRVTEFGQTRFEQTGNALFAKVVHATNREGDPNLHTHSLLLNMTRRNDGQIVALDNQLIFKNKLDLGLVYKASLAVELRKIGYSLRPTKTGFEIEDISDKEIVLFSKRRRQIEADLADKGLNNASVSQRQVSALETRSKKVEENLEVRKSDWLKQLADHNLPTTVCNRGPEFESVSLNFPVVNENEQINCAEKVNALLEAGIQHLSEREQAFDLADLKIFAIAHGAGQIDIDSLQKGILELQEANRLLATGAKCKNSARDLFTTDIALRLEKKILTAERMTRNSQKPLVSDAGSLFDGSGMNEGQHRAASLICTSKNQIIGVQGFAGTGKTFMLQHVQRVANTMGAVLLGLGPTLAAKSALQDALIPANTLAQFLVNPQLSDNLKPGTIIVLDESGLVGANDMNKLIDIVQAKGAKLVLVGDKDQYQSVSAGPIFEQLQSSGMQTAAMDQLQRQKTESLKVAAQLAVQGRTSESLDYLDVRECSDEKMRLASIANEYCSLKKPEDSLILTGTNSARKAINKVIRQALGLAGNGTEVHVFEKTDMSAAEKKMLGAYRVGLQIRFNKDLKSLGIEGGQVLTVQSIEAGQVIVVDEHGERKSLSPASYQANTFDLGHVEQIEISKKEKIRFTATNRKLGFRNGDLADVLSVTDGTISLRLKSGKKITLNLHQHKGPLPIRHGYALTGHSAQGLGVGTVLMDRTSFDRTTSVRQFMTDITRAKQSLVVFTDDKEKLKQSVSVQTHKTTALHVEPGHQLLTDLLIEDPLFAL